jgi:hypothetical protein
MKKIALTFILLLTILKLSGQDHISIGLNGSIGGNKYFFKESGFDYEYKSRLASSLGFGVQYLFKNIFIFTGLEYTTWGYQLEYNYIFMDPGDPAIPRQSELKVTYFTLPVMAGIQLYHKNKISFNPSAGFDLNFQTECNENTLFEDNSERESKFLNQNLHKTQVIFELDFATEYHLAKKFKVLVAPYVGKGLSLLDFESMKTGQLSYGCKFGFYYMF